jgi:hypothetical protein
MSYVMYPKYQLWVDKFSKIIQSTVQESKCTFRVLVQTGIQHVQCIVIFNKSNTGLGICICPPPPDMYAEN